MYLKYGRLNIPVHTISFFTRDLIIIDWPLDSFVYNNNVTLGMVWYSIYEHLPVGTWLFTFAALTLRYIINWILHIIQELSFLFPWPGIFYWQTSLNISSFNFLAIKWRTCDQIWFQYIECSCLVLRISLFVFFSF